MPRTKITPEIEGRILQLHRAGESYKSIGRQVGLDWRTAKGVVNRRTKAQEQEHWKAVSIRVDAEFLRQHYSVLMLLAQEVRSVVNGDITERANTDSQALLEGALARAVSLALDHGMIPGIPQVERGGRATNGIKLVAHGHLLFTSLGEHEPKLKTLISRWEHSWDAVMHDRRALSTDVMESLLTDETRKDLEEQGLKPSQVDDIFNAAITEALEFKLKGLELMEFETPTGEVQEVMRRARKNPFYEVRSHLVTGKDPDKAKKFYESVLELALRQPEIWDRLDSVHKEVMRRKEDINQFIAALALRGRPAGRCTLCPSAVS